MQENPFDKYASAYDEWFDTPVGRQIFGIELSALRKAIGQDRVEGKWIEIGVGSGRFAIELGIKFGIDPAANAIELAKSRGIQAMQAQAEEIPFNDMSFDGALTCTAFCFFDNQQEALAEICRILKPHAKFIIGTIPATSPWGQMYIEKKRAGHKFYSLAEFFSPNQIISMSKEAGFELLGGASALLAPPGLPSYENDVEDGINPQAGFVAMAFVKKTNPS